MVIEVRVVCGCGASCGLLRAPLVGAVDHVGDERLKLHHPRGHEDSVVLWCTG